MSRGDYHWQHEPCWYAVRRGRSSHWQGDRTQSTVWSVPNLNPLGGDRAGENAVYWPRYAEAGPLGRARHPEPHVADQAIYDPFVGSGTAIIAAEKAGRIAFAMELDPVYVQATMDRWEAYTGAVPSAAATPSWRADMKRRGPRRTPSRGGKGGWEPPARIRARERRAVELAVLGMDPT